ncbi:SH3 domain-containing protein 19 isoform X1 [Esox lucius]|uniref:SH3 domain-containing protein n=2 Tax=Esox lucius TaxID=8010 RepID=A0A3P9A2J5_ESOLU|nr:SH3 domain-containing protein 19 isoform X1 [Esox lucius]
MAESKREEEELRDMRDLRNRNQATDRAERNKPEVFHSSQGPLSSIRAAIKRTRTSSPSEQTRERRRPEITILSAEPLATNTWFPGASGGFTAPPLPPTQPSWGGSKQTGSQPPPSYDQVIKEKTQEVVVTPTAAPRRSITTTIATQTDPVEDEPAAGPECTAPPSEPVETRRASVKVIPAKPPRPSLPKPLQSDFTPGTAVSGLVLEGPAATTTTDSADQTDPRSAVAQHGPAISSCSASRAPSHLSSVSVEWDVPIKPSEPSSVTTDSSEPKLPLFAEPAPTERPTPLPRLKSRKQPVTDEVKVQTLVRVSDNGSGSVADASGEAPPPGKYLQELLDVFYPEGRCYQNSDSSDYQTPTDGSGQSCEESDEDGNMATLQSQRNIRARIQAFESQEGSEDPGFKRPEPQPRNTQFKPPVGAAKPAPALAPKPSIKRPGNIYQEASSMFSDNSIPSKPIPAPRPVLPRKPSFVVTSEPESEAQPPCETANLSRSRLSIAERAKKLFPQEVDEPRMVPPNPPEKPRKEPLGVNLNLNNHNSASIPIEANAENEYMDDPFIKPVRNPVGGDASFSRQSVTRRPTTIRVPSKGNLLDDVLENPPPLPAQMPVGSLLPTVTRMQSFSTRAPAQDPFDSEPPLVLPSRPGGAKSFLPRSVSFNSEPVPGLPPRPGGAMIFPARSVSFDPEPVPGLPPRPGGAKVLPPRPPPAKVGPGRPPPPRIDSPRQSPSFRRDPVSLPVPSAKQAQKPKKKGPILPPRPNPGHRLYNTYTLGLPHGIAEFDYNGRETGELSFQKNEVLLLVEQLDSKTFQCQVGDIQGRVQKSYMKIITPLASGPAKPAAQNTSPVGSRRDRSSLQVQALHDFSPEGPGELGLRVGDVVTDVEQVDREWYRGSCRGSSGFFPVTYVKVLLNAPTPTSKKKSGRPSGPTSGPRCLARFDFEGEQGDELTFNEGDVIQLKEYLDEEWARGQMGTQMGIFPLNFVEVIEDLPPPPQLQRRQSAPTRVALPGLASSTKTHEATKPVQSLSSGGVEWAVALYDYEGETAEDLSFQLGDRILVTQHLDAEWCSGRLNGREGLFPSSYVEMSSGHSPVLDKQGVTNGRGSCGKALYDFTAECDEELSMKAGDIITDLESIDDEWFLGRLRGKQALVPKNYVQVLT